MGHMSNEQHLTAIVGGTGKTGRRVSDRLQSSGRAVRVASRRTDPPFDWNDPTTWRRAVAGCDAAYVTFYPDLAFPGAAEKLGRFAELAVAAGVDRLVLLSGRGEPGAELSERAVRAAAPNCTVLRCSWFAQNFSEHVLLGPILDGVIALPAGDVSEPFVDLDDVADVAVAALVNDGHAGATYELTGPRSITFADAAAEIAAASGRRVIYVPVTETEFIVGAVAEGMPVDEAEALADVFAQVLDGRNSGVTADVAMVLGRPARDFRDYARAAAATGVWADAAAKAS
jgi:uncharacterized protein YbjT (DUF2867 family)